jgi:hypothetical protein
MEVAAPPLNPWLSMWTRPRETVRQLLRTSPAWVILLLAALAGVGQVLDNASFRNLGDSYPAGMIVVLAVLLGPAFGIIGLYIGGVLVAWTGHWIGGTAPARDVRTAMAWAGLPLVAGLVVWVFDLALFGSEMFTSYTPRLEASLGLALLMLVSGVVSLVLGVWAMVLLCKSVGEVHGFSAWKGLGAMLLAGLVVVGPIVALAAVAAVLV